MKTIAPAELTALEKSGIHYLDTEALEATNGGMIIGGFPWKVLGGYFLDHWPDIKKGVHDGWNWA